MTCKPHPSPKQIVARAPWNWDDRTGPARLERELKEHGLTRFRCDQASQMIARNPRALLDRWFPQKLHEHHVLTHVRVEEKAQANTHKNDFFDLHTDIVGNAYLPPHLQIMICLRPAEVGGESLVQDGWAILRRLQKKRPALFRRLFHIPRLDVRMAATLVGPLVSDRWGNLVCTCPVRPTSSDEIGRQFKRESMRTPPAAFRPRAGEVLVLNNHRWLHGRTAFEGNERHLVRILAWRRSPLPSPRDWNEIAQSVSAEIRKNLRGQPRWLRERFTVAPFRRKLLESRANGEADRTLSEACDHLASRLAD
jgi:gamma-butyrobetaine dioxygenase